MYRQFNIQQFYVLPTQCIYVFCVDLRNMFFSQYFGFPLSVTFHQATLFSEIGEHWVDKNFDLAQEG